MTKKTKRITIAAGIAFMLAIGSIGAYLTASESNTNAFNIGNVRAELSEPSWNQTAASDLHQGMCIAKDPQITNTGDNDAYIFAEVTIPSRKILNYDPDTLMREASVRKTHLFQINAAADALYTDTNTVTSGWTLIDTSDDPDDDFLTLTYAYGTASAMTKLPSGSVTAPLFRSVTYCYAVEGQGMEEDEDIDIGITMYAVQADNLEDNSNEAVTPAAVWQIISNSLINCAVKPLASAMGI